ncbi:MAG: hypothetical protein IPL28_06140 [Chloroflexi bacterium]|nr:hypothetical protein [Chloroflexota bacterium]
MTGIAYNTQFVQTPPTSWNVLLDPKEVCGSYNGVASLIDENREVLGAALTYLGYDYNDTNPNHHQEAIILLKEIEPCLAGYYVGSTLPNWVNKELFVATIGYIEPAQFENDLLPALVNGELWVAHAWSGAPPKPPMK